MTGNVSLSNYANAAARVEAGAALNWMARAKALNWSAEEMEAKGAPLAAVTMRKTLTTGALPGAGASVVLAFAENAAPVSAFMRLLSNGLFQRTPLYTRLIYATGDATGSLVAQGAPIPAFDLDLEGQVLQPQKAAALTVATDEAWRDISAAGQTFIAGLLNRAVGRTVDEAMITAFGTIPGFTAAADDIAAIRTAMQAAIGALIREAGQRFVWVLSPAAVKILCPVSPGDRVTVDLSGTGSIFGAPVTVTNALPEGDLLLVSASDIAAALVDINIDASNDGTVQFTQPPTNNSATPTASTMVSMFQTNSVAVRTIVDFAIGALRDTVAARVTLTEDP